MVATSRRMSLLFVFSVCFSLSELTIRNAQRIRGWRARGFAYIGLWLLRTNVCLRKAYLKIEMEKWNGFDGEWEKLKFFVAQPIFNYAKHTQIFKRHANCASWRNGMKQGADEVEWEEMRLIHQKCTLIVFNFICNKLNLFSFLLLHSLLFYFQGATEL